MQDYIDYFVARLRNSREMQYAFMFFMLVVGAIPVWFLLNVLPAIKSFAGLSILDHYLVTAVFVPNRTWTLPLVDAIVIFTFLSFWTALSIKIIFISRLSFLSNFIIFSIFPATTIVLGLLFGSP